MLKRIVCTLLLVLVSCGCSRNTPNISVPERFIWITSTSDVNVYYDPQTIIYPSDYNNGISESFSPDYKIPLWISWNYTKDGARKKVKDNRAKGLWKEAKWDNFSYILEHQVISKNLYKSHEIIYYNVNGNVIDSKTYDQNTKWQSIVPGTIEEVIRDKFIYVPTVKLS